MDHAAATMTALSTLAMPDYLAFIEELKRLPIKWQPAFQSGPLRNKLQVRLVHAGFAELRADVVAYLEDSPIEKTQDSTRRQFLYLVSGPNHLTQLQEAAFRDFRKFHPDEDPERIVRVTVVEVCEIRMTEWGEQLIDWINRSENVVRCVPRLLRVGPQYVTPISMDSYRFESKRGSGANIAAAQAIATASATVGDVHVHVQPVIQSAVHSQTTASASESGSATSQDKDAALRPIKMLIGKDEICDAVGRPTETWDYILGLNNKEKTRGPIVTQSGGKPLVDKAELIEWWNRLPEIIASQSETRTSKRADENANLESSHAYGRNNTEIVPEIGGSVKKRRRKKAD